MSRDNSGQISGQTRDIRDTNLSRTRDTRDKPPLGGCPCPGKDGSRPEQQLPSAAGVGRVFEPDVPA